MVYLLDTHVLIWLLEDNPKLDKNIREKIEYFDGIYYISYISIFEIINLMQLKKISIGISIKELFKKIDDFKIKIIQLWQTELLSLEKLPLLNINGKLHSDIFDRLIIASAISKPTSTLISADKKFPAYRRYGLDLIELSS